MRWTGMSLAVAVLALGCDPVKGVTDAGAGGDDAAVEIDAGPGVIDAGPEPDAVPRSPDLDVLFVIDNSGTMEEEQAALEAAFDPFIGALAGGGPLPNLHIGVITTDLGAGPFAITGCNGNGDNGVLQGRGSDETCSALDGNFIIDVAADGAGRTRNYTGTLSDTFACMAKVGIQGCGFEQPLEALRRALDNTVENAGFLRDEAGLVVVILSDEDDCSVFDTNMFDPSGSEPDGSLGPLSSFRCFEFGVRCDPDRPRELGEKSDCAPRPDSPFMTEVADYVEHMQSLKGGRVVVAAVVGPPEPVVVGTSEQGTPEVQPSCATVSSNPVPATRTGAFAAAFGSRGLARSICDPIGGAMMAAANLARTTLLE